MKRDIFIASPLFNPLQHAIIDQIESALKVHGLTYYSARHDSEAYVPKGADKKLPGAWQRVFDNNEEGLEGCSVMIAVLNYALPPEQQPGIGFYVQEPFEHHIKMADFKPIEIPDSGTVWEMGNFRGRDKLVVGFHPDKRGDHLNLMLTHGCDGLLTGFNALRAFLQPPTTMVTADLQMIVSPARYEGLQACSRELAQRLDWGVVEHWGAQNAEVAL